VFSRIATGANAPTGTSLDFSEMQTLAGSPREMVLALNTLMMHGQMSNEMTDAVVTAVNAVGASNALRRVQTAVYLIATSAQYQVAR
jgi:hypothetical protein